jgi:hypothetical protein
MKPHTHEWKDPEIDFNRLGSTAYINFLIFAQICECGAIRVNRGPMGCGWKVIREGRSEEECPTENSTL